jgi:hypothetical protein
MFVETAYKHSVSEEEMYCKAHPTDRLLLLSKETYIKKYMRKTKLPQVDNSACLSVCLSYALPCDKSPTGKFCFSAWLYNTKVPILQNSSKQ